MTLHRMALRVGVVCALSAFIGAACAQAELQHEATQTTVSAGKEISLEYTLKLQDRQDKQVIDSNVGADPLKYTHGAHQLIPGLEAALDGMAAGERKEVTLSPDQAYGPVDPQQVREVPKELVPQDAQKVGTELKGKGPHGEPMFMKVVEVKENTVILDFNHPLAGRTLYFDVKVLEVKEATTARP